MAKGFGQSETFAVRDLVVRRGEKLRGRLLAGRLADGSPIDIPVIVAHGREAGPVLYVQAACHGIEVNGIEVIRRLDQEIEPERLTGTILMVPVANVLGFNYRVRQTVFDLEDLNRVWPGKKTGRISERIAHLLFSEMVSRADYLLDLHTGSSTMVTHVRYFGEDPTCSALARVFGTRVVVDEPLDVNARALRFDGKLRNVALREGVCGITPELGGHSKFDQQAIRVGFAGVRNILIHLGMLRGTIELPPEQTVLKLDTQPLTANWGGLFLSQVEPGERVRQGQTLGVIYNPQTFDILEEVLAPQEGMVLSFNENPVVHTGERLASLGLIEGIWENH